MLSSRNEHFISISILDSSNLLTTIPQPFQLCFPLNVSVCKWHAPTLEKKISSKAFDSVGCGNRVETIISQYRSAGPRAWVMILLCKKQLGFLNVYTPPPNPCIRYMNIHIYIFTMIKSVRPKPSKYICNVYLNNVHLYLHVYI